MNNDEMRNIINISEGIVKNPDGTPKTFKRTEQMKVPNPTGIDRFLGRGKTDDWDEYPMPKKPKGVERRTHDHENAHGINEHSAEQSMRDDAQEILRYLSSLARASRYSSNGAGALVQKMEAITSFITKDEMTEGFEESDSFTYNRDGVPTEHEITEQDKYVMNVLEKLRGLYADLKANGIELPSHGSDGNAMDVLYDDLLSYSILDRYVRYYLKVPGLDGGTDNNSHPYLG